MNPILRMHGQRLSGTPEIVSRPEPVCDWRDVDAWPALPDLVTPALSDPSAPPRGDANATVASPRPPPEEIPSIAALTFGHAGSSPRRIVP